MLQSFIDSVREQVRLRPHLSAFVPLIHKLPEHMEWKSKQTAVALCADSVVLCHRGLPYPAALETLRTAMARDRLKMRAVRLMNQQQALQAFGPVGGLIMQALDDPEDDPYLHALLMAVEKPYGEREPVFGRHTYTESYVSMPVGMKSEWQVGLIERISLDRAKLLYNAATNGQHLKPEFCVGVNNEIFEEDQQAIR
jgi:hypothetical protein